MPDDPSAADQGGRENFHLKLETETIAQVVSADPLCVEEETKTRDVLRLLRQQRRGCALICRAGRLVGIFTERDALRLLATAGTQDEALLDQPVSAVMVQNPVTIETGAPVAEAIRKMSRGGYRRLPVVDAEGRPVGVMKVSGILHYFVEHFPKCVYTLPPHPHHAMQEREGA
jgi:CBS domain-containing protein